MTIRSVDKYGDIDKNSLIEKLQTLPEGKEIYDTDEAIYVVYPDYIFEIDLETGDVKYPETEIVEDATPGELAGVGTEANPYLIESIEDLVAFSNNVNNGTNVYSGKYIKLVKTLDFKLPFSYVNSKTKVSEKTNRIIEEDEEGTEILTFLTTGTGFNPIGGQSRYFYGNFDGNGKEIRNIYINRAEEDYVGLFARSKKKIFNLSVTGNVTGKLCTAGIAGDFEGIIENCKNFATITGRSQVGGISGNDGQYSGTPTILNCYNYGNIVATDGYTGGIAGQNMGSIEICHNTGNINSNNYYAGGISGYNFKEIKKCSNSGEIKGYGYTGGISGAGGTIELSYNSGKINTSNYYTGGISGYSGTIINCYNKRELYSSSSDIGGINGGYLTNIKYSYNLGKIEGKGYCGRNFRFQQ